MKRFIVTILIIMLTSTLFSCDEAVQVTERADRPLADMSVAAAAELVPDGADIVSAFATCDFLDLYNSADLSEYFPEYIMLHFSSAVMTSPDAPYDMDAIREIFEENEVGTHYIIDREGEIICYVPEQYDAWHAGRGKWSYDDRFSDKMNNYAIGIELVGIGSQSDMSAYLSPYEYGRYASLAGFTEEQYSALDLLIDDICTRYDIPRDREHIIGHEDYNVNKSDPGELFNWDRII